MFPCTPLKLLREARQKRISANAGNLTQTILTLAEPDSGQLLGSPRLEIRNCYLANLIGRSGGGNPNQQSRTPVKLDQRRRAAVIGFQSHSDRLRPVIFPLKQLPLTLVASARDFRRTLGHVEYRLAFLAGPPSAQSIHNLTHCQFVVHHRGQGESFAVHQLLERLSLPQRARESIQNESSAAPQAANAFPYHLPHRCIRHQIAATKAAVITLTRRFALEL